MSVSPADQCVIFKSLGSGSAAYPQIPFSSFIVTDWSLCEWDPELWSILSDALPLSCSHFCYYHPCNLIWKLIHLCSSDPSYEEHDICYLFTNVFLVKWGELRCMFVIVLRIYSNSLMIISHCNNVVGWYELVFDYLEEKATIFYYYLSCSSWSVYSPWDSYSPWEFHSQRYIWTFFIYFHICVRICT